VGCTFKSGLTAGILIGGTLISAALIPGCFEDNVPIETTPGPGSSASGSSTMGTATTPAGPSGDEATMGTGGTTASTVDTSSTVADSTGELPPPLCGDGVPVPGELCWEDTTVLMANDAPYSARLGDVSGTSDVDVVHLLPDQLVIRVGDGEGDFSRAIFDASVTAEHLELADFDGDDDLDVVILEVGGPLRLLLGSGAGAFTSSDQVVVGADPSAMAVGDLDGDGAPDVVVGTAASGLLFVVHGGGGTLSPLPAVALGAEVHGLALADFDGDDELDIAIAVQGGRNGVLVSLGEGGGLGLPQLSPGQASGVRAIATGDFDGDAQPDIAYVSDAPSSIGVLLGDGSGGFADELSADTGPSPSVVLAEDLSGNGRDELLVAHEGEAMLRIYFIEPGGALTEAGQLLLPAAASALDTGDVNGDAVPDIAATSTAAEIITLLVSTP